MFLLSVVDEQNSLPESVVKCEYLYCGYVQGPPLPQYVCFTMVQMIWALKMKAYQQLNNS